MAKYDLKIIKNNQIHIVSFFFFVYFLVYKDLLTVTATSFKISIDIMFETINEEFYDFLIKELKFTKINVQKTEQTVENTENVMEVDLVNIIYINKFSISFSFRLTLRLYTDSDYIINKVVVDAIHFLNPSNTYIVTLFKYISGTYNILENKLSI